MFSSLTLASTVRIIQPTKLQSSSSDSKPSLEGPFAELPGAEGMDVHDVFQLHGLVIIISIQSVVISELDLSLSQSPSQESVDLYPPGRKGLGYPGKLVAPDSRLPGHHALLLPDEE